ncbi:DUF3108 domain-containing protein [Azospira restricta]|uniref:DUF3108 domain-containing protein n=1 Tax=Azospira restricta TaxID=404405 RepID=A0A974SNA7_9RHOO|nr:DUF3108 domain-containing protein [Azospira restricta]QRJ63535.1 DUF3108 domain-containing protein [Azospira restricta]
MPFALAAALLASLGLHAAALLLPDVEPAPTPSPEPAPLQAEIVLQPRVAPVAVPPAPAARAAKPARRPVRPPSAPPAVAATEVAATEVAATEAAAGVDAVADAGAAAAAPPSSEAMPSAAEPPAAVEPAATSPQLPASGEIRYVVHRGDPPTLIGSARHRWQMADGRYRIESVMETTGVAAWLRAVRVETESSGALVAGGLQPERYVSRRLDRERERVEQVDFDREAGLVRFGKGATAPLPAGAQDLLSFNYQLGWLARTGDLAIATGRKLGTYRLELLGKEWVETPRQPMWTLHFRASGETTTEVWLAPDNYLLPVKIRHIDKKGESFEQLAEDIRLDPPPAAAP